MTIDPTIYFEAADLIEEHGWFDGNSHGLSNTNCTATAICRASHARRMPGEESWQTFARVERPHLYAFAEHMGLRQVAEMVYDWNDAQPSADVVVAALRACGWAHSRYPAIFHEVTT